MHTSIYAGSTDGLYLLGRGVVNIIGEILSAVGILTGVWGYFMVLVQASKVDGKNGLWLLGSVFLPPISSSSWGCIGLNRRVVSSSSFWVQGSR